MQGVEMREDARVESVGTAGTGAQLLIYGNGKQGESAPLPAPEQTPHRGLGDCSLPTVYAPIFGKNKKTPAEADEKRILMAFKTEKERYAYVKGIKKGMRGGKTYGKKKKPRKSAPRQELRLPLG